MNATNLVETERTHEANRGAKILTLFPTSRGKIIGRHAAIREVLDTIQRVAHTACTVLVTGESGTGKELVVAALHDASPRRDKPMVTVNCGAIPENLLESELFGHAKGSFTGAHATRVGRVSAAEGGTLFLDEIGELPLQLQVKLLRLLQQKEYSPVGDNRAIKCDIRVVAATNRDLEAEVAAGRFREDLYYRLNVIQVQIPALRERGDDAAVLATHFFDRFVAQSGRSDLIGIAPEAMEAITRYEWPGNVRALENAIERCVLLSRGPFIELEDLPARIRGEAPSTGKTPAANGKDQTLPDAGIDLRAAIDEFESNMLKQALTRTGWNKNRAAQLLGLNRTTLVEMVKRKGLTGT
jgi:sigma-54 specific flagellar transcriptional regulator A